MPRFPATYGSLLVMLLCSTLGAAQIGKSMLGEIIGQVRLANDVPAPVGTMVLLERADSGVVAHGQTDSQGKFQFRGLEQMPYRITVRLRGYETSETNVDLQFISHSYVQIKLKPLPGSPEKVPPPGAGGVISARDAQIPPAAVAEFEKGKKLLLESNNPDNAIPHFAKAVQIYDRFAQAYLLLGVAYSAEKKWSDASAALNKAIEIDANSSPAYLALGSLQNSQKDFSGAEKSLLKAVELNPDSADAHFELGRTYWAMNRWQEADPHATKAVLLRPDNAAAHVLMGNILLRKRDAPGAVKEFQESLRLDPNGPLAPGTRQMVAKIEAALNSSK